MEDVKDLAKVDYQVFLTQLDMVINDKGFTYPQLAALLGMKYTNFRRLMLGKYTFPVLTLFSLFRILEVNCMLVDCLTINQLRNLCEEEEDSAATVVVAGDECNV